MSSSTAFQRGMILFGQRRFDLADREFRQVVVEDPDDPFAHAYLALCLAQREAYDDAQREVDEAVRLGPDIAFIHYGRASILLDRKRLKEAEAAIDEAIRLDPNDADYRAVQALIAAGREHWAEALQAAEEGLAIDPEHTGCTNLRAMALVHLGRKEEAGAALGSALAVDPEDPFTHANQGWTLLHQGDPKAALVHFREALRLDPTNDWARAGTVEALKARYLVYRLMLGFFLWLGRQGRHAQWALILGFIFGRRILADIARTHPRLAPWIAPILILTFAFLLLTWIASPLFNLLLRLDRTGRLALTPAERRESSWIGGSFLIALAALAVHLTTGSGCAFLIMTSFGLIVLPLVVTFRQPPGLNQKTLAVATFCLALLVVPIMALHFSGGRVRLVAPDTALELWQAFLFGCFASTWIPALFSLRR